ncbi:hypothetical protein LDG_8308 [Legionella drancourtii LLAP12]|uniref:Uncharacterized protein n=1 Tax=Legionella drancourtii LLAP12 TaxID=658187 RepID=G9ESN7_9GAMM|nr:hypothetical protein LDG_8308 [Legionella drancourtii LLAP12]
MAAPTELAHKIKNKTIFTFFNLFSVFKVKDPRDALKSAFFNSVDCLSANAKHIGSPLDLP